MRWLLVLILSMVFGGTSQAYQAVVLGNSITFSEPQPALGWTLSNGMAASSPDRDFAHLFLQGVGVEYHKAYLRNMYPFEFELQHAPQQVDALRPVFESRPEIVILELGDNVTPTPDGVAQQAFRRAFAGLARLAGRHSGQLFCLSTWWQSPEKDQAIEESCAAEGGHYVFIGDIRLRTRDAEKLHFKDAGVNAHPGDIGMRAIAQRLLDAYRGAVPGAKVPGLGTGGQ